MISGVSNAHVCAQGHANMCVLKHHEFYSSTPTNTIPKQHDHAEKNTFQNEAYTSPFPQSTHCIPSVHCFRSHLAAERPPSTAHCSAAWPPLGRSGSTALQAVRSYPPSTPRPHPGAALAATAARAPQTRAPPAKMIQIGTYS